MWQDPIVAETRALREEYAQEFGHDPEAIFQDILRKQATHKHLLVSFQQRKPVSVLVVAQQGTPVDAEKRHG